MIAFDYAKRADLYFPVVLFFMFCHTICTIIVGALFKALIWEAYFTVHAEYQDQSQKQIILNKKDF
jgi:hypothetical protein